MMQPHRMGTYVAPGMQGVTTVSIELVSINCADVASGRLFNGDLVPVRAASRGINLDASCYAVRRCWLFMLTIIAATCVSACQSMFMRHLCAPCFLHYRRLTQEAEHFEMRIEMLSAFVRVCACILSTFVPRSSPGESSWPDLRMRPTTRHRRRVANSGGKHLALRCCSFRLYAVYVAALNAPSEKAQASWLNICQRSARPNELVN